VERVLIRLGEVEECRVVKRINRFVAKVEIRGREYLAYVCNTGRLEDYLRIGKKGYCLWNSRGLKTQLRLFAVEEMGLGALIDTQLQMMCFEEALARDVVPWLRGYRVVRRNPKLGGSRLDYLLRRGRKILFTEVKSAVLRGDHEYAMYPDCPSRRGRRHVKELIKLVREGGAGLIVFLACLPHVRGFKPNECIDPVMAKLLREAAREGVLVRALSLYYSPSDSSIYLDNPDLEVML